MLVTPSDLPELYEAIKLETYQSAERKITIFASTAECDSVCAARILQSILKDEGIASSLFLVSSYLELETQCRQQAEKDEQELKNLILINCGAREDIPTRLQLPETTQVIVIDSHRPVNLGFQSWERVYFVYDPDDGTSVDAMPEPEGFSSPDEEEEDEDEPGALGQAGDDSENNENEAGNRARKRRRQDPARKEERKERRRQLRRRRRQYYEKRSLWGRPASSILYELARQLNLGDPHLLWMSIVALTDQITHQRISPEKYQSYVSALELEVNNSAHMEIDQEIRLVADGGQDGEFVQAVVSKPVYGVITAMQDFRFTLMRHWSLYDAMLHSTYVAARMHTYTDQGQRRLNDLLAKMGFLIRDCKLDYVSMPSRVAKMLSQQLALHAPQFQLGNVSFRSFQRKWGYAPGLAASDLVHAVTALLEFEHEPGRPTRTPDDRFLKAWKALAVTDNGELTEGLELAKRLQRAILSDGGMLLARHAIKEGAGYRWVSLLLEEVNNQTLFSHPLALTKLGFFLREVLIQQRRKPKAFVLVGPHNHARACLVVAIITQPSGASEHGDKFGVLFEQASKNVGAEFRHDGFDSCVVEMAAGDVERFMRELSVLSNKTRMDQPR